MDKTDLLERQIKLSKYDSPGYHRLVAELHRELGGPCGCYSCGHAKKAAA